jgi:hypothetical protein
MNAITQSTLPSANGSAARVGDVSLDLAVGLVGRGEHCRRGVDADDGVPKLLQVAREPTLATP